MSPWRRAGLEAAVYTALFTYVFWFRIHGIEDAFILQGDQMRDWDVARRRLVDLPLSGVPSSAGGTTIGPTYFWLLWVIAAVVGPPLDNLPHAGGVGIAMLQSMADVVLAWALVRRTDSLLIALATVGLGATSVPDAALSSTIWSPPVGVALTKLALAGVLAGAPGTLGSTVWVAVLAWGAVQVHTTGILIAVPVLAWAVGCRTHTTAGLSRLARVGAVVGVIVLMQVPWLWYIRTAPARPPSTIRSSLVAAVRAPWSTLRPGPSVAALDDGLASLLFQPREAPGALAAVAAGGVALSALSRDFRLAVAGPLPIAVAVVVFSLWQANYDLHWMLVLVPSASISLLAWSATLSGRWRAGLGALSVALVALLQPGRYDAVRAYNAVPGYGALVSGCRQIRADGRAVEALTTEMAVASGNPLWLCSLLGIGLTPDAPERAVIRADGSVEYMPAR